MHRAPAVIFAVTRSRWHLYAMVSLALLAAILAGAFANTQPNHDVLTWVPAGASLGAFAVAISAWRKSPAGLLHWDGRSWHWSGFSAAKGCSLSLLIDFQKVLLVSLEDTGAQPVWLWLQADPGDSRWLPLRRAIVSSRGILAGEQEANPLEKDGYLA